MTCGHPGFITWMSHEGTERVRVVGRVSFGSGRMPTNGSCVLGQRSFLATRGSSDLLREA